MYNFQEKVSRIQDIKKRTKGLRTAAALGYPRRRRRRAGPMIRKYPRTSCSAPRRILLAILRRRTGHVTCVMNVRRHNFQLSSSRRDEDTANALSMSFGS